MYATQQDLLNRLDPKHLVELADDDNDGVADTAVLDAVLADAAARVDSYLVRLYSLPLATIPTLLIGLSADLAIAALFSRRREARSPLHEARAKQALETLEALGSGELLLAGFAQNPGSSNIQSTSSGVDKIFTRETLK